VYLNGTNFRGTKFCGFKNAFRGINFRGWARVRIFRGYKFLQIFFIFQNRKIKKKQKDVNSQQ